MTRLSRAPWLLLALAVTFAPPASADTYLVYSGGGIIPSSSLFTWCDGGQPCETLSPLSCTTDIFDGVVASPEGGTAFLTRTNVWAGWGVFAQGYEVDLSAYDGGDLKFWVKAPDIADGPYNLKIEFECNPDPIGMPGGLTLTTSIADHGWDETNNWQEISIPVCSFFGGTCDAAALQCLSTVTSPFLATIENLPFFNWFWIDYVRWEKANSHAGASTVQVQGKQLIVNGEPFVVNGVAYAPLSIGENWTGAWRDRPDRYSIDFPLIAASGANTIRVYAPLLSTAMLDAAWANGLHVIPTYGVDPNQLTCAGGKQFMIDRFVEMVNDWKDHPAILFWLVGNEVNLNLGAASLCGDWFPQLDAMAAAAHAAEGPSFHPVATANADTGDVCVAGCSDDTALPNVDLWALQLYRGCDFGTAFTDYQKPDCNRPMVITEFGMDSYDSVLDVENEILQANCLQTLLEDAEDELNVRNPSGASAGQVVFSWADEWWKADEVCGTGWEFHDGCDSFTNFAYPDPGINEEWWGLVSLDENDASVRTTREAYNRVETLWRLNTVLDLEFASHDSGTGDTDITFDPAAGSSDHTLYYGPLSAVSTYGYSGTVADLGGSGSATVTLPAGSLFTLVAPRNNDAEGCYGKDALGNERPCFPNPGPCNLPEEVNRSCDVPTP